MQLLVKQTNSAFTDMGSAYRFSVSDSAESFVKN